MHHIYNSAKVSVLLPGGGDEAVALLGWNDSFAWAEQWFAWVER
jgi:hypothetical protein